MSRLVAVQMVSSKDIDDNLKQLERLLRGIKPGDLVLLPENFAIFSDPRATKQAAEELGNGKVQQFLSEQAKLKQCFLVAGSLPIKRAEAIFASSIVYDPHGQLLASYDKLHLFDVDIDDGVGSYRESDTYQAGGQVQVFDTPLGRVGMAICYDLRFPELFSTLRELGADILLLPAAFTKVTGQVHWQALLQARAIENQCYLIAANQGGNHENGRETWGHSMIIGPWGDILAQHGQGAAVIQSKMDPVQLNKIRNKMPISKHQRFDRKLVK